MTSCNIYNMFLMITAWNVRKLPVEIRRQVVQRQVSAAVVTLVFLHTSHQRTDEVTAPQHLSAAWCKHREWPTGCCDHWCFETGEICSKDDSTSGCRGRQSGQQQPAVYIPDKVKQKTIVANHEIMTQGFIHPGISGHCHQYKPLVQFQTGFMYKPSCYVFTRRIYLFYFLTKFFEYLPV